MNPVDQFTPQEPILFNPVDLLSPDYIAQSSQELHARISPLYSVDETSWLSELLPLAKPSDEERKAAMVSNLLVVLCGDRNVQPVVNTGTLYN